MLGGEPFPPPKTVSVFPLWEEWVLSAFLQATAFPSPGLGWEAENQQMVSSAVPVSLAFLTASKKRKAGRPSGTSVVPKQSFHGASLIRELRPRWRVAPRRTPRRQEGWRCMSVP